MTREQLVKELAALYERDFSAFMERWRKASDNPNEFRPPVAGRLRSGIVAELADRELGLHQSKAGPS
jgi:hypothetical protein